MVSLKKALLICLFLSISAFSYSYTAYGIMTGKSTLAFNPLFYTNTVGGYRTTGSDIVTAYGITDNVDFWYDLGLIDTNGSHLTTSWSTMLRYDVFSGNILALKTSSSALSLQYHTTIENKNFGFQANGVVQSIYDDMKKPSAWAILCPLFKYAAGYDVFCEVNPGYYAQDKGSFNNWTRPKGFGLDVVPGLGFSIKDVLFSVAAPIYDATNKPAVTFGAWVFYAITK